MRDGLNHLLQSAGIRVEPGKLIIEGDLEVPNGSIRNDFLESPIEARSFFDTASGFDPAVSSFQVEASVTLTVPADRTKAIVIANGGYGIRNTTPSTGTMIHGRCSIGGYAGPVDSAYSEPGRRDTGAPSYAITVPSLTPGDTLTVELQCYGSADFVADADNFATLTGVVLWLRA
ncbi:hypothetical protein [Actinotalea fermentans]|nr:hypothetical protein [Actinotalea fermentans]KGM17178.1 hypothetical protein N867_09225 [Actinotalea fermentans ATCC 43279 = JCM 9966 = DSM 3133]